MSKKILCLWLCLTLCVGVAVAQNITVNGRVIFADDNSPAAGVYVQIVGTSIGTQTNNEGEFVLENVPENSIIKATFIGMKPVEMKAAPNMIFRLEEEVQTIDAVVFTGYKTQSARSITGSLAKVSGNVIEKKNDANFVKSLEGSVTGIQMNNSTGQPGTYGSIFIRGKGSLNSGDQPLYVIDGVPVNSDQDGMYSSSNNNQDPMAALNPSDIESLTILKDAAATAIYGSRAANGVILINTKKGTTGKFNLNLDIRSGFSTVANNNMKFANAAQTMDLFAKGRVAAGLSTDYDAAVETLTNNYKWDGKTDTDWLKLITRRGAYKDYNLSLNGQIGSEGNTTSYYVSLGYLDSKGIVIASDFNRYSGRINLDSKFKMFTFGLNAAYSMTTKNSGSQSTGGSFSNPQVSAISSMLPFYSPYDENGDYTAYDYMPLSLWDKKLGDIDQTKTTTLTVSPNIMVNFGQGIYAKTTLGVNIYNFREYVYWGALYNPQGSDYNGLGQQYNSQTKTLTLTNLLGWNKVFNSRHDISLLFGQEMQRKSYFSEYYSGYDFPFASIGMRDLMTVGSWNDSEYARRSAKLASYFFDAQYSLDYKYYISTSFRRDGSSVFGADKRWGNFWSVGGKWRFSEENFLKNNVITDGTLRASYGTVGNQDIGWYAARGFYQSGFNYNSSAGMVPTSISNSKLTWERSNKMNIGADFTFINTINLGIDFYNEITSDALFQVPLSETTGMSSTYMNIGKIRNRGVEIELSANIISKENLKLNAFANMTSNANRVVKLSTDKPIEGTTTIIEVGRPYRQFYMKEYAGVDKENGKPLFYKNAEGDETTSNINEASKRYLGSATPKIFGGFGANLEWKGLDVSIAFNYRLGSKVFDSGAKFTGWGMTTRTPLKEVIGNTWTPENPDAKYPQYITNDPNGATDNSHSRFLYSGNFLKLNNLTIGYTLPKKLTQKAMLEKVRFYVSGDNLYTFTSKNFVGYTPETYESGVIAWQYPSVRTLIFGVQLSF